MPHSLVASKVINVQLMPDLVVFKTNELAVCCNVLTEDDTKLMYVA